MTPVTRSSLRDAVTTEYFGDGPPHWIVGAEKLWERPAQTSCQAARVRDEVVRKLDWHRHHLHVRDCAAIADKLDACRSNRRCFCGACPICLRATQRWFVDRGQRFGAWLNTARGQNIKIFSLVPDFGTVPVGELAEFDWRAFRARSEGALRKSGVDRFLTGVDVSMNHWDGSRDEAVFQFQFWGLVEEPPGPWRERFKETVNRCRSVIRPIYSFEPRSVRASLAYGLKSEFTRRVSYVRESANRDDRGPAQDTRGRKLR